MVVGAGVVEAVLVGLLTVLFDVVFLLLFAVCCLLCACCLVFGVLCLVLFCCSFRMVMQSLLGCLKNVMVVSSVSFPAVTTLTVYPGPKYPRSVVWRRSDSQSSSAFF